MGYLFALLTYLGGQQVTIGDRVELFHGNSSMGVVYFFVLALVILITNLTVRGLASVIVILSALVVTLALAYFGLWDSVLRWFGNLSIHLNLGAYFWFSTLMFLIWAVTTFIFDHLSYWRIRPGQVTQEFVFGAATKSYDTENMVLEKHRDDVFRHWALGLGSGDLRIKPYGSEREELSIPNVLFIGSKVRAIQHMISIQPEAFGHSVLK